MSFDCAKCGEESYLIVGYETVTVGTRGRPGTPDFEPRKSLDPWDEEYSCKWSSGGLRVSYGDRRWIVKSCDD